MLCKILSYISNPKRRMLLLFTIYMSKMRYQSLKKKKKDRSLIKIHICLTQSLSLYAVSSPGISHRNYSEQVFKISPAKSRSQTNKQKGEINVNYLVNAGS